MKFVFSLLTICAVVLSANDSNVTKEGLQDFFNSKDPHASKYQAEFKKAYESFNKGKFDEAFEIWQDICAKKDAQSCTNLGFMYDGGLGVKQDYNKALDFYSQACDNGDPLGCKNLGITYFKGEGVKQSFAKAAEAFKKGCDLNEGFSCANLGYQYENGDGVAQDELKAVEFYTKSCLNDNAMGCTNLGTMHANGTGGLKQDFKKAEQLFKKGCDLKDENGCKFYKQISGDDFTKNHANMGS